MGSFNKFKRKKYLNLKTYCFGLIAVILVCFELRFTFLSKSTTTPVGLINTGVALEIEPFCKMPYLPLYPPEITPHLTKVNRIMCNGAEEDWVQVHNNESYAFVTESTKAKYGPVTCTFEDVERVVGDEKTRLGKKRTGQHYKFENNDFVLVECESKLHGKRWVSVLASSRSVLALPDSKTNTKAQSNTRNRGRRLHPKLNVLIWGHDSLSRNMFIRKLNKSYNYLKNELGGHVLEGYNIVGDGTPQALIPILTGQTEEELPETRKSHGIDAQFVNVYPFLWKTFRANGYLTGYMEDCPHIGTFQYRLKGFQEQPTDFYMRPYFLEATKYYNKFPNLCIGSVPRHKVVMDYVKRIMVAKREVPKFVFSFHSELSHDDMNLIEGADEDLTNFLTQLRSIGVLNETILVLMSDHGSRFSSWRNTQQGKLEERLPVFMFVFPSWFHKVYPIPYQNFVRNTKLLSTPFDIHETIQDILRFDGLPHDSAYFQGNQMVKRGMSLFRPIAEDRSCAQAQIEPHWCACLQWKITPNDSTIVKKAAEKLVNFINNITESNREICSVLEMSQILSSAVLYPKNELLKFKKTKDADGRVADLSGALAVSQVILQLKVETKPGLGHFEASIMLNVNANNYEIRESDISRINKYGEQARCVQTGALESLRKYCYCH